MIENIVLTNINEATSYFSWSLVAFVIFFGVLPAIAIYKLKISYASSFIKGILLRLSLAGCDLLLVVAIVAPNFQIYHSIVRESPTLRKEIQPVSYLFASFQYIYTVLFTNYYPYVPLGNDAQLVSTSDKPKVLFFVIGESARAYNFGSLGYERNTNEYTQQKNFLNFSKVYSCATSTAQSIPCMFSDMKRSNFNKEEAVKRDNLIAILAKANLDLVWFDNDGGCIGVCKNIKTINTYNRTNSKLCNNGGCLDEIMLEEASKIASSATKDTIVFLHLIGSHVQYNDRYPESFKRYIPVCNRADIENCTLDELRNAYDNTIVYTDYLLYSMVNDILEPNMDKINPALFYISDHGESLGENGFFIHSTPYTEAPDYQKHIPMQLWLPNTTAKSIGLDKQCLKDNATNQELSHDNVFSTILGLMQVKTKEYQVQDDAFAKCRKPITN